MSPMYASICTYSIFLYKRTAFPTGRRGKVTMGPNTGGKVAARSEQHNISACRGETQLIGRRFLLRELLSAAGGRASGDTPG